MIEDYAKIEIAKQAVKAQKLQEELLTGKMTDTDVSFVAYSEQFAYFSQTMRID